MSYTVQVIDVDVKLRPNVSTEDKRQLENFLGHFTDDGTLNWLVWDFSGRKYYEDDWLAIAPYIEGYIIFSTNEYGFTVFKNEFKDGEMYDISARILFENDNLTEILKKRDHKFVTSLYSFSDIDNILSSGILDDEFDDKDTTELSYSDKEEILSLASSRFKDFLNNTDYQKGVLLDAIYEVLSTY